MAKGGGWMQVFPIFLENGKSSLQTKFLTVGSSLGHLPMKKFSDRTYRLGSKIRQREDGLILPTVLPTKMKFSLNNFLYEVR